CAHGSLCPHNVDGASNGPPGNNFCVTINEFSRYLAYDVMVFVLEAQDQEITEFFVGETRESRVRPPRSRSKKQIEEKIVRITVSIRFDKACRERLTHRFTIGKIYHIERI